MGWKRPVSDRFWEKVEKTPTCWNWKAAKTIAGYGVFGVDTHLVTTAHRWAYHNLIGDIPAGAVIDHLCNNRGCVNPSHLRAITQQENMQAAHVKLRRAAFLKWPNGSE